MSPTRSRPWLLLFAVLGAACGSAPTVPGADPAAQLRFGVDMARRGLWREAMFRFEQARELRPGDGERGDQRPPHEAAPVAAGAGGASLSPVDSRPAVKPW